MKTQNNSTDISQHEIVEAARRMFDSKGFDRTSIEDLLEQLGTQSHVFFKPLDSLDKLPEVVWSGS